MRYKNYKKISNLSSPDSFFSTSKCTKIRFQPGLRPGAHWGSLRRSPRPPSRLGRGIPRPHSPPRSTPSTSRTRRLGSQAPSTQNPGYASAAMFLLYFSVARYHRTTSAQRYHFCTVPVPVRYFLIPQYHKYCGS